MQNDFKKPGEHQQQAGVRLVSCAVSNANN